MKRTPQWQRDIAAQCTSRVLTLLKGHVDPTTRLKLACPIFNGILGEMDGFEIGKVSTRTIAPPPG